MRVKHDNDSIVFIYIFSFINLEIIFILARITFYDNKKCPPMAIKKYDAVNQKTE